MHALGPLYCVNPGSIIVYIRATMTDLSSCMCSKLALCGGSLDPTCMHAQYMLGNFGSPRRLSVYNYIILNTMQIRLAVMHMRTQLHGAHDTLSISMLD